MGRSEVEEKQILSDLGKFISAIKTAKKAAKNKKKLEKRAAEAAKSSKKTDAKSTAESRKKERLARKRQNNGGTVTITFKGGYSTLNRGASGALDEKLESKRALFRAKKTLVNRTQFNDTVTQDQADADVEAARLRAERAEAREEARQAAADGLEEGEELEAEEEDEEEIAVDVPTRVEKPFVGAQFAKLVENTGGSIVPLAPQPFDGSDSFDSEEQQKLFFALRENPSTKCIVKLKGARNAKSTTTISTTKGLNYFKTNFGQLLKKEVMLGKAATGGDRAPAANAGNNSNNAKASSGKGKKKK